jgi:hypothetical protein
MWYCRYALFVKGDSVFVVFENPSGKRVTVAVSLTILVGKSSTFYTSNHYPLTNKDLPSFRTYRLLSVFRPRCSLDPWIIGNTDLLNS